MSTKKPKSVTALKGVAAVKTKKPKRKAATKGPPKTIPNPNKKAEKPANYVVDRDGNKVKRANEYPGRQPK